MKQRQQLTATLGLIAALSTVSPVPVAAGGPSSVEAAGASTIVQNAPAAAAPGRQEAQSALPASAAPYKLSLEQMDSVSAGAGIHPFYSWLFNVCPDCVVDLIMNHGVNIYE